MKSEKKRYFTICRDYLTTMWLNFNWRTRISFIIFIIVAIFVNYVYYHQTRVNDGSLSDLRRRVKEWKEDKVPHPILVSRHVPRSLYHYHEAIDMINKDDGEKFWLILHSPYPLLNINYWIYPKEAYMDVETQVMHYNNLLNLTNDTQNPKPPKSGYDKIMRVEPIYAEFIEE